MAKHLLVEFPNQVGLTQDAEWFSVMVNGQKRKIRMHEYAEIYDIAGLYEELFYGQLKCASPKTLAGLLGEALRRADVPPDSLRGIDLGAGNGMVGEELRHLGISSLVGLDILPEAEKAATRDRPHVYRDYVVADLTVPSQEMCARLTAHNPNLLASVAALGFGDIPSMVFVNAWNLLTTPAWVVFNIKQEFLNPEYDYGFSLLLRRLRTEGLLDMRMELGYQHRLALDGRPLHYVGIAGMKTAQIPNTWLTELEKRTKTHS